uniref:Uncharacterized protein n=1 Tax=Arundo donax TaxID=35708 RepID=A0A0A9DHC2_ARUDO
MQVSSYVASLTHTINRLAHPSNLPSPTTHTQLAL